MVEGNEEPEGKTGLPGGRDKVKLMRRSLEARLLGEDFEPEWEWKKLLGGGRAGGMGAVPLVWSRAEEEFAGQRESDGRAGVGQGRRTPGLGGMPQGLWEEGIH